MNHIVLASHSKMAEGIAETVMFFLPNSRLTILEQTVNDDGFEQKVINVLESNTDKNIIVFTDLYGGSVNQIFFRQLVNYKFHLVTGMNLALILECAMMIDDINKDSLRNIILEARNQISYMNDLFNTVTDD
ncbi:MAG: hypothetical protein VB009_02655 [Erysipelotrichaceae bacterium]|nr:hypothetical protein [Erysipelotrichaceae bacterium]